MPPGSIRLGMPLPEAIYPCADVALIDAAASAMGIDVGELMQRAARALADEAEALAPEGTVLVATGPGNNGGDGWACARMLAERGHSVLVWPVVAPKSTLCKEQAERARAEPRLREISGLPEEPLTLIIDALLGAGARGEPREPIASALRGLARCDAPFLAADVPTGLGSELVLPAIRTLCFQVGKTELLDTPGIGPWRSVDIGIPLAAWQELHPVLFRRFPQYRADGHKGDNGELLVFAGGPYPGALEYSCRSAMRGGDDLVRAWTGDGPPLPPHVITVRQTGAVLAPTQRAALAAQIERASAVLIGPGLGRAEQTAEATRQVYQLAQEFGRTTVVDADGLTHLAALLRDKPADSAPVVVTPHRGEATTLLDGEPSDEALHAFARPDRIVLRKGRVDLVSDGRRWQQNPRGNPRMAVGGTGDCLAGITAGLCARGAEPYDAARLAILWITDCADELWRTDGPCYLAEDIIERLPATLRRHLEAVASWPPLAD